MFYRRKIRRLPLVTDCHVLVSVHYRVAVSYDQHIPTYLYVMTESNVLRDASLFATCAAVSAPLGCVRSQPSVGRAETPAPAEPLVTRLITAAVGSDRCLL